MRGRFCQNEVKNIFLLKRAEGGSMDAIIIGAIKTNSSIFFIAGGYVITDYLLTIVRRMNLGNKIPRVIIVEKEKEKSGNLLLTSRAGRRLGELRLNRKTDLWEIHDSPRGYIPGWKSPDKIDFITPLNSCCYFDSSRNWECEDDNSGTLFIKCPICGTHVPGTRAVRVRYSWQGYEYGTNRGGVSEETILFLSGPRKGYIGINDLGLGNAGPISPEKLEEFMILPQGTKWDPPRGSFWTLWRI